MLSKQDKQVSTIRDQVRHMTEKNRVIGEALEQSSNRLTHIDKRLENSEYEMQKNSNELARMLR